MTLGIDVIHGEIAIGSGSNDGSGDPLYLGLEQGFGPAIQDDFGNDFFVGGFSMEWNLAKSADQYYEPGTTYAFSIYGSRPPVERRAPSVVDDRIRFPEWGRGKRMALQPAPRVYLRKAAHGANGNDNLLKIVEVFLVIRSFGDAGNSGRTYGYQADLRPGAVLSVARGLVLPIAGVTTLIDP
ncbi:MAG: hypothetical protein ABL966_01070 [Acidimicrobiales bacterium]